MPYTVTDAARIEASLTGRPGDPARGARLFATEPAGCGDCHAGPGQGGDEAPDLAGIGARMSRGELRLWLVAPEVRDPRLGWHAFYRAGQRTGVDDPLHGGPHLTAAQIEDLLAYLAHPGGHAGGPDGAAPGR